MYHVSRLKSGVTVITAEMPHMASVSLGVWVGVGGRYEPAAVAGVSHFIEHMLFKGTLRRTAREISQAVEGIGGYLNAFTGEESTCFYARVSHDRFDEVFEVLMDMFIASRFAPEEIEKERGVIKEEIAMYLDQPHQHVQELLNETMWPNHPLGTPLTGTNETIDRISRRDLLTYQLTNYNTATTLIAAAGNIRHAQLVKAAERQARNIPSGKRPRFTPVNERQTAPRLKLFTRDTAQMQLALGLRGCSRHDPRRYALRVLNALLGDNMSSRLFQSLREEHGLAYSVHSSVSYLDDTGALAISAGLDTGNLEKALALTMKELKRFTATLPTAKELKQARDYLIGHLDLSLENTENQMMWLGDQFLGYGRVLTPAEIKKSVSAVTAAHVRQAARAYFRPENMSLAMVSPLKTGKGIERLLRT
ncbi:MAG: insulinase family protein [Verrucomicrobia subdivision 3 bacterium]|nr:insulinase family protein [Limisphaerales bacterium]